MSKCFRKLIRLFVLLCIGVSVLTLPETEVQAAKKINLKNGCENIVSSSDYEKGAAKLARKLGLRKHRSSKYTVYYTGKKMKVGANSWHVGWPKKYLYVSNKGNKNIRIFGIKIGDKKSVVRKKMKKAGFVSYDGGKTFGIDYDGYVFKYKNGKVKSWTYQFYPTS